MKKRRAACVVVLVLGLAVSGQRTSPGIISYGNPCEESSQCSPFGSGAVCRELRCGCDTQFFFNGTRCLYKRGLGESCIRTEFGCYLEIGGHLNVVCENGICACVSGFVPNPKSKECLQAAQSFGDVCEINNQCSPLGAGSRCKEGKCVCDGDSFFDGSKCLYKKALGEFCNRPEFGCYMSSGKERVVCNDDGTCQCAEGFVISEYSSEYQKGSCIEVSTYGGRCTQNSQCSPFRGQCSSYSRYRTCRCDSELFYDGFRCLTKRGLNEDCSGPDDGCYLGNRGGTENVVCRSGRCDYVDGYTGTKNYNYTYWPRNTTDNYRCNYGGQQLSLSLLTLLVAVCANLKASCVL